MNSREMLITVDVQNCHLDVWIPASFEKLPLVNLRKISKMLSAEPWRNEETYEKLRQFFPEWERDLKERLEERQETLEAAEREIRAAESRVACFGTVATKEMKDNLRELRRRLKKPGAAVKSANAALERCRKVISAYKNIVQQPCKTIDDKKSKHIGG